MINKFIAKHNLHIRVNNILIPSVFYTKDQILDWESFITFSIFFPAFLDITITSLISDLI